MAQNQHTFNNDIRITVVGSINSDLTIYVRNFPAQNQTILARNSLLTVGGKGLNQAVAASKAGGNINFISALGNDVFGHMARSYLTANMISTDYIKTVEHIASGTASIMVSDKGDNMIAVAPGANSHLIPGDILKHKEIIQSSDILVVQLEVPLETVKIALDVASEAGVITILNPAPALQAAGDLIKLADYITPNETETEEIVGIYPHDANSAKEACEKLRQLGARNIIITMGKDGYYLSINGQETLEKAFQVDALDPTGAGDVFNGVFAVALAREKSPSLSAQYAAVAAALSVKKFGAQDAAPTWTEIESYMKNNKSV